MLSIVAFLLALTFSMQAEAADIEMVRSLVEGQTSSCRPQKASTSVPVENSVQPHLFVFVSASMPKETLKSLMKEAQKVGGVLILRGLVQDSFKDTSTFVREIGEGLWIDPTLFETYGITMVPTFVVSEQPYERDGQSAPFDKISGNVTLHYALEQMVQKGTTQRAKLLSAQFKKGNRQ